MNSGRPNAPHKRSVCNFTWLKCAAPTISSSAFRAANNAGVDSLYVVSSRQTVLNIKRIVEFATQSRLPLAGGWGAWAKEGGLFSYGPDGLNMARRAANYIDRIFKGAKPADLPVEQPTKFELIINLKTARRWVLLFHTRCFRAPMN